MSESALPESMPGREDTLCCGRVNGGAKIRLMRSSAESPDISLSKARRICIARLRHCSSDPGTCPRAAVPEMRRHGHAASPLPRARPDGPSIGPCGMQGLPGVRSGLPGYPYQAVPVVAIVEPAARLPHREHPQACCGGDFRCLGWCADRRPDPDSAGLWRLHLMPVLREK